MLHGWTQSGKARYVLELPQLTIDHPLGPFDTWKNGGKNSIGCLVGQQYLGRCRFGKYLEQTAATCLHLQFPAMHFLNLSSHLRCTPGLIFFALASRSVSQSVMGVTKGEYVCLLVLIFKLFFSPTPALLTLSMAYIGSSLATRWPFLPAG